MSPSGSRVWFAVTIASIFVLCCASGVAAASHLRRPQATAGVRAAQQAIPATLTKSLGLTPETACSGRDRIAVRVGTQVYACYTLANPGSTPFEPLTLLDGGALINWVPPAPGFLLNPGETLPPSLANGLIRPFTAGTSNLVDERAEWNVDPRTGTVIEQVLSNPTTVRVFAPTSLQTTVLLTAGTVRETCATGGVTITSYSTTVYYCVTIQNGSPISLTRHVINIPALGLSNLAVPIAVGPTGTATSTLRITNTVPALNLSIPQLAQPLAAPSLSVVATVTSSDSDGDLTVTSSSAPLVVSGPAAGITLLKTLNSDPGSCSNLSLVTVNSGDRIYYCLTVTNSSSFTFTHHTFAEPTTNISGSFQAILRPGGRITLTNATLPNYGVAPVLGPLVARQSFNNTMNFTAVNPAFNYRAAASASASVNVIPGTPTPTDEPTPTFTSEPFDTPTPTPSLTPFPPTPTWTATWTPSPTFTPAPTVLAFTTPGGVPATPYPSLAQVGQGQPQTGPFTSPLDPFAATATASALFGFPTPIIDPFAATATASALFGFPTPIIDPFAATATASALFGFPTPIIDPFAATATAASLAAFPTPIIDPFAATATAAAALAAQPASPLATLAPEVAVLPPSTVIMVTATPTVDLSATPTQRPVAPGSPPAQATGGQQLFSQILDSAGLTVAFLWLLGGFVVMFLVMGVLAGLSIKPKTQGPFSLADREDANYVAEATTKPQSESDEPWPDALP